MEIFDEVPVRGLQRDGFALDQQVEKELETGLTAGNIRIFHFSAGVAQLVEHFLAKEDVASSSLVTRFSSARAERHAIYQTEIKSRYAGKGRSELYGMPIL